MVTRDAQASYRAVAWPLDRTGKLENDHIESVGFFRKFDLYSTGRSVAFFVNYQGSQIGKIAIDRSPVLLSCAVLSGEVCARRHSGSIQGRRAHNIPEENKR